MSKLNGSGKRTKLDEKLDAALAGLTKRDRFELMRRLIHEIKPEVAGTAEVAVLLGIHPDRSRIARWRGKNQMPASIGVCTTVVPGNRRSAETSDPVSGPLWLVADILPMRERVEANRRKEAAPTSAASSSA